MEIVDDEVFEDTESFQITIFSTNTSDERVILDVTMVTIQINDDDQGEYQYGLFSTIIIIHYSFKKIYFFFLQHPLI